MQPGAPSTRIVRFGAFELDLRAGELRKHGLKLKLQDQPFQILVMLLEEPGQVVTREQFQQKLWSEGTFVDFEHGLNAAIQRLRQVLGDSADSPRFVETVARRGYRFVAPMARVTADQASQEVQQIGGDERENRPRLRRSRQVLPWALVAIVSFALVAAIRFRPQPGKTRPVRFQVLPPERVTQHLHDVPAVSPDGRHFAFSGTDSAGKRHLWLHSLDSLATRQLPEAQTDHFPCRPFWSPDSRFVGYFQGDKLKKIDIKGGRSSVLCDAPYPVFGGAAWSPDGTILFASLQGVLRRVSAAGGQSTVAIGLDKSRNEVAQMWPHFLPDGRHFLYWSQCIDAAKSGTYLASLDSREKRRLLSSESNVAYAPPGFLVYGQQDRLVAQPFNAVGFRISGEPVPIAERVEQTDNPGFAFSVSNTGVLVYRAAVPNNTQLVWYARDGTRLGSVGEPGDYGQIALSPDDRRLAVERQDTPHHTSNIWILDLSSGVFSRKTFFDDGEPVWSPDGRELLFSSVRGAKWSLFRKVVGEAGERLIFESTEDMYSENWVPDGKSIIIIDHEGKAFSQVPLTGDRKPVVLLKSEFYKDEPHVSPDQHWIAYNSAESGRWEVYVATFPGFTAKRQVSNNGGAQALWRRDGKELFYLSLDGRLMAVDVRAGTSMETGVPHALFRTPLLAVANQDQYCVTRGGRRFLFAESVEDDARPTVVVLNWTPE